MTLSQLELALLSGLPLRKLDQLIASRCAPIYARPQSRKVACYTLHEAVMLATGMMLHERYSLGWPSSTTRSLIWWPSGWHYVQNQSYTDAPF